MNRRTFLKSTAITLITPTLLLKGNISPDPLQWIPFSSKLPKYKEFILIGEKYENSICYVMGTRDGENAAFVGSLFLTENKKTGKKEYNIAKHIGEKWEPYKYQINKNSCYWISMTDLLKHMKNTPINQSNINMDIQCYTYYCGIYAGKVTNVDKQNVKTITNNFFDQEAKLCQDQYHFNKNSIIGWTKLPNLPNISL